MRERLTFEKEMLELSIEAEAPTAISEYSFILTPVEVPGGGGLRIEL